MVWQKKPNPRYNVVSLRISDADLDTLDRLRGRASRSDILRWALNELLKVKPHALRTRQGQK